MGVLHATSSSQNLKAGLHVVVVDPPVPCTWADQGRQFLRVQRRYVDAPDPKGQSGRPSSCRIRRGHLSPGEKESSSSGLFRALGAAGAVVITMGAGGLRVSSGFPRGISWLCLAGGLAEDKEPGDPRVTRPSRPSRPHLLVPPGWPKSREQPC